MKLVNHMEEVVTHTLEEMLGEPSYRQLNLTEKMRLDVIAFSLNQLPPKYVVTEKGHLFTRVQELRQQFNTDIVVALTKAIHQVQSHPR